MNWKNISKKKRTYITIACTLIGILLWAFISAKVITHDFNRQLVSTEGDNQQATVQGVILTETKDKVKYWEIYGETGKWDSHNGVAQLDNVIGNFYKDDKVSMSLESSKGTYDSKNKIITLYEKTFIVMDGGITLNADKLTYVDSKTPIIAEGHVKITKDNKLLSTADKITISPGYESFKIEGNTQSKVYGDKE